MALIRPAMAAALFMGLGPPGRAQEEFFSARGYLEQGWDHYFVDTPADDFQRGVWSQAYRLDLGGNYGLALLKSTDLGLSYLGSENLGPVIMDGRAAAREHLDYHARASLALPLIEQVAFTPFISRSRESSALPTDPRVMTWDESQGATLDLSFPFLPTYTTTYRRSNRGFDDGLRQSLDLAEFSERAAWRRGVFSAGYEHRRQDTRDLWSAGRDSTWDSMSLEALAADSNLKLKGLRAYSGQAAWRQWDSTTAAAGAASRSANASLYLDSRTWTGLGLDSSFRLGESYSRQEGGDSFSHSASLQSLRQAGAHSFSNRLESTWSAGSLRASDFYTMNLRYWNRALESQWVLEETYLDSGDCWWRDFASHRLRLDRGRGLDLFSTQDYTANRAALGPGRDQALGFSAGGGWRPLASLRLGATWRTGSQSSYQNGQDSATDTLSLELHASPLPRLSADLQYWFLASRPGDSVSHSLFGQADWEPARNLKLKLGCHYSDDSRSPRRGLATANPFSYLNIEAAASYRLGKTEFAVTYKRNEKDYANAFHQASASLKRTF